ncbi:MAG: hypothetical protein H6629_13705 [Calditrichae bacterium]|nr:hypothetical protein [Calditrichia bacterium]
MNKWINIIAVVLGLAQMVFGQENVQNPQSNVQNPHGKIKWECVDCHTTESWTEMKDPMVFRHEATGFALVGAHKITQCMSCHESPKFAEVGAACADCHTDVHQGEFGINCQSCHTAQTWENRIDVRQLHAARGFPLSGGHAVADCQSCHISEQRNEFAGTASACFSCHIAEFNETVDPDHQQAGFSLNCENCHQPAAIAWNQNVRFDHSIFELRGAHKTTECAACHTEQFTGTPRECFACHEADFQTAQLPDHISLGFPTECAECHNETRWQGAAFDHISASGFPLNGAHSTIFCAECHVDNQMTGLPRDCFGCHNDDYQETTDPNHVLGNFPQDCLVCHNELTFVPADFDHNLTQFPLTGAHATLQCESCHETGDFTALPTECYSCHQPDFEGTTDPGHVQNNFSFDCTLCHSTSAWEPATFDHNATDFPLTGAHIGLDCLSCHSSGYAGTPTACVSCHEDDFQATTDPNHIAAAFPLECEVCHSTVAWEPAIFDHDNTDFPLTGAHTGVDCNSCHASGYTGTPTACVSCHQSDFDNTTDPNHIAANFPVQCEVCHSTTAWEPANWNHDQLYFPIYSGEHRNEWDTCADCHLDQTNFATFECIFCHEHRQSEMDDEHNDVNNYVYESTACYNCHPDGRELMQLDRMRN